MTITNINKITNLKLYINNFYSSLLAVLKTKKNIEELEQTNEKLYTI